MRQNRQALNIKFAVCWITVVILLMPIAASAQDIPGKWAVGIRSGPSFLTSEDVTTLTDAKVGPIVSANLAYSLTSSFSLGLNIEWQTNKLQPANFAGLSGDFSTISIIPFGEIRLTALKPLIPYALLGIGVNINSITDAKIESCIGTLGFSPAPIVIVVDCEFQPENTLALKFGGGVDYLIASNLALNIEIGWKLNKGNADISNVAFPLSSRDFNVKLLSKIQAT